MSTVVSSSFSKSQPINSSKTGESVMLYDFPPFLFSDLSNFFLFFFHNSNKTDFMAVLLKYANYNKTFLQYL